MFDYLLDKYNSFADKIVGAEIEAILKPLGNGLLEAAIFVGHTLTDYMPEIGAGFTIICGVGMMITGKVPKWFARWGFGMMGAIIWLAVA
ncbi:hypothetical protein WD019_15060 [Fictibacillus sp. Mic-4]|uniref:hypothetical protein n=1 Tax=Fictibacillus sp. Mic-4 TaxID=3132826 RepID=UPI003CEEA2B8